MILSAIFEIMLSNFLFVLHEDDRSDEHNADA